MNLHQVMSGIADRDRHGRRLRGDGIGKWFSWIAALVLLSVMTPSAWANPAGPLTWTTTATVKASNAGWGRMTKLSNGDWLSVYTLFPAGQPTILEIARSTDNARTWSVVTTVSESGRDIDNGNLLQLPNGTVLLTMRSIINGQSYRLTVHQSANNGANWSFLSTIDANESPGGLTNRGLWEPVFNILADGSLSVLYANEKYAGSSPAYNQVISQKISTNNGASWGSETWEADVRIASGGGDAGLIFRATSLGAGSDAMNGYYAGLNDAGDTLVLGRMNGAWTQLAAVPLSIATNTWYRLKVVAMGSDIRVYVGDLSVPKIHVTDGTWTVGAVGVRAHFTNASFDLVTATK